MGVMLPFDPAVGLICRGGVQTRNPRYVAVPQGLVGYWPFDPDCQISSTLTADLSGNANNGTLFGSPALTQGQIGTALSFDGAATYVDTALVPSIGASAVSYSVWFKTSTASQSGGLIGTRAAGAGNPQIVLVMAGDTSGNPGAKLLGSSYDGTPRTSLTTATYADGRWHHAVLVHTSTVDNIYVDGALAATASSSALNIANTTRLLIGCNPAGNVPLAGWYFTGSIDDPRAYNRTLDPWEVIQIYQAGLAGRRDAGAWLPAECEMPSLTAPVTPPSPGPSNAGVGGFGGYGGKPRRPILTLARHDGDREAASRHARSIAGRILGDAPRGGEGGAAESQPAPPVKARRPTVEQPEPREPKRDQTLAAAESVLALAETVVRAEEILDAAAQGARQQLESRLVEQQQIQEQIMRAHASALADEDEAAAIALILALA